MIQDKGCELVVSPYGTSRTLAAIRASDPLQVINLAFSTGMPALTTLTYPWNNVFAWGHRAPNAGTEVANLLGKVAKTYVLVCSSESGALNFCSGVPKIFGDAGLTLLRTQYVNVSSVDTADVVTSVVPAIRQVLDGITPDVFVCSFLPDQFQGLVTAFEAAKPNVKAAVLLSPIWSNIQQVPANMGNVGDGWISITPFPYSIEVGQVGSYGGSSLEFVEGYVNQFNMQPIPFPALTVAMLNTYTLAVERAGSVNSTLVRKALIDLEAVYTVAGLLKFDANHSNSYPRWFPFQFLEGNGVSLQSSADLVYPAPFPWLIVKEKEVDVKLIVSIAVPVGVVFIVAVIIGIVYIRHQRHAVVQALVKTEEGERRNYKIDFSAIEIHTLLGSGSFGHVYKGDYRGTSVAIKKLKQQNLTKKQLDEFASEASVMVGLRHPNILLFMGVCLEPSNLCIIAELMTKGSLYDILNNSDIEMSFSFKIRLALDALRGLQFIHSAGFLHRDLKSPNLLVDKSWNIKIADFGLSCGKGHSASNAQVSLLWTAPEVLEYENDSYTEKSDVYSFAIILWEIMSRKLPWESVAPAAIHTAVVAGKRPLVDTNWGEQVFKALTTGWAQKPNARPSVKELRVMLESIPINENEVPTISNNTSTSNSGSREKYPNPPCAIAFCEVENEHLLWQRDPHVTLKSLKKYNEVVKTQLKRLAGYEVPSDSNVIMAAFHEPVAAVNFCMRIQNDLLQSVWPTALDDVPFVETEDGADGLLYKGIRVCMSVHYGPATVQRDEEDQLSYNGPLINEGQQLAHCASGGQILISGEVYAIINSEKRLDPFYVENMASVNFPKRKDEITLYEIVPKQLKGRLGARSDYLEQLQFGSTPPAPPQMMQKWIIPYDALTISTLIGTGLSGEVFKGTYAGQQVAIKQFSKQKLKDNTVLEMRAESAKLYSVNNGNVTKFIGMCTNQAHICLVTELLEKGDLSNILYKQDELPWSLRMRIVKDIAKGLHHLHSINLIHRDIKSRNIFVGADWTAKIGDLGFTVIKAANQTMTQVGTVAWTSPEIFEGSHYSEKADIYGFAIVLWEIVFRRKPWDGTHTMKVINNVLAGQRLPLTNPAPSTPAVILELINLCWQQVPEQRPSTAQILAKLETAF